MSAGTLPFTPRPTAAYAPTPTTSARISRKSSAPRRRRWTNCMRAPDCCAMSSAPCAGGRLVDGEAGDGLLGLVEAAGPDAGLDGPCGEGVELVDLHVGRLVGVGELDARNVGLDAPEDRDDAVLLPDVVLMLAPVPRRRGDHPPDADQAQEEQAASEPRVAPRLARGVSSGLRIGVDRERHSRREV